MRPRLRVVARADRFHAERKPGDAVRTVDRDQPFGKRKGFLDGAALQGGEESEFQKIRVLRIGTQHRPIIVRRRRNIALGTSDARGEKAAGWRCVKFGYPRQLRLRARGQRGKQNDTDAEPA